MYRSLVAMIFLVGAVCAYPAQANETVFADVAKVKECWLTCREEAEIAGERAHAYFVGNAELTQSEIDAFATLTMFYVRVFLERGDYVTANEIIQSFLSRGLEPTDVYELGSIHVSAGIMYISTGQLVLAENAYNEGLKIFREIGRKDAEGIVLSNLANVSLERSRVTKAIEYYQTAIPLLEAHGKPGNLSTTLNNLGIQLTLKEQFSLAEEYIQRAGELIKDSQNLRKQIQVIQAYIWWFIYSEKFQEALDYALENEALILDSDLKDLKAHYFVQLGTVREKLAQYVQAQDAFREGLKLAEEINARSSAETASVGLARLAGKQGDPSQASEQLQKLYDDAIEAERYLFAETIQTELIDALSNDNQYQKAYDELNEYLDAYRARVEDSQENELSQYLALLETEEEKRKVAELQRDNVQQALELSLSETRRQQTVTVLIATALVLVSITIWLSQRRRIANIQAKAAQDLLNKKNVLFSEISHELKTPITAIQLQIEALEHELAAHPERAYALVYDKLASLNRLIDDVFQLSKADSGDLDLCLESINAKHYMRELAETFAPQLADKDIGFDIDDSASENAIIDLDPRRFEQVFANLISNTIRYTDAPGQCRLTLQSQADRFLIGFEDSAPGVAEGNLHRLFDRLFREDVSRNRALGGSGLGLSIVRAFVEAHGGSIKASKSELGGVRFDISLPAYTSKSNQ